MYVTIKNSNDLRKCESFKQASEMCRAHIVRYDMGSNWRGGKIVDEAGNQIARVSYNGRVWNMDGSEIAI